MRRLLLGLALFGCSTAPSTEAPPPCLDGGIDLACTPAYPATYDDLYTNTFQKTCTISGFACHSAQGHQANIDFSDPDNAFGELSRRVRPGSPECSILVHRVVTTDKMVRMPPAQPLSAEEQCAIMQWIANGAKR